jgi:hypothetical protein
MERPGSGKPKRTLRGPVWEFYRDSEGWRWRRVDDQGNVSRLATQSYRHLLECAASARLAGYRPDSESRFISWPA